nr:translation elongation factor 1-alpha [Ipomoea batatas]
MLTSSSEQPCKTTKWWVLREGFNNHGLGGNHLHHASITILQELGLLLQLLTRPSINLGQKFSKLDCNVGSVAVQHGSISITDLSRVVHDDDLRGEVSSSFGWVILGVRGNITTLQILHSNILNVEPNIVTGKCLLKGFVVHFNRLNFSGKTRRSKCHNHTRLQDTSLHTTHRDGTNTTNLVHILKWKSEGLVRWPLGLVDHVECLKEGWSLVPVKDETSFTISSYLALEYLGVVASICRTQSTKQHIICLTPRVKASKACSRVCPSLEIPASKPPVVESMMRTAQSAWKEREGEDSGLENTERNKSERVKRGDEELINQVQVVS